MSNEVTQEKNDESNWVRITDYTRGIFEVRAVFGFLIWGLYAFFLEHNAKMAKLVRRKRDRERGEGIENHWDFRNLFWKKVARRSERSRTKSFSAFWPRVNSEREQNHPLLRRIFAPAPNYPRSECGKALCMATPATQAKNIPKVAVGSSKGIYGRTSTYRDGNWGTR